MSVPNFIWGALAWLEIKKESLQLMAYIGDLSQTGKRWRRMGQEVNAWFIQCGPLRSHRKSTRRFREVDLVLSLNSGPPSLSTPSQPKCQNRAWFPFMECKINRSSAAGEGPSSPDHNAELGVGGRGEKQLLSVWLVFGIDFHFLQPLFSRSLPVRKVQE